MERPLEGRGRPVCGGSACGPAFCPPDNPQSLVETPDGENQKTRLELARLTALDGLSTLARRHRQDSAEILEFQIEILDDPTLLAALETHLERGLSAAAAWTAAFSELQASFAQSGDDELKDRVVDLVDARNRGLRALGGIQQDDFPAGSIFVADDMEPSLFLAHDWSKGGGILLKEGSDASHVAILARARSIPMIIQTGPVDCLTGDHLMIDGQTGHFGAAQPQPLLASRVARNPVLPVDPRRPQTIRLLANISDPEEIRGLSLKGLDGIGLVRTEFLVRSDRDLYDQDRQSEIYSALLDIAGNKPVTFRLFDFGFDKPVPGTRARRDTSPLGLRGLRLLLKNPDLVRVQIRALLLASIGHTCRILVPMVTVPEEMQKIRAIIIREFDNLKPDHPDLVLPVIGMMVEVPAAVLRLDAFDAADFFSFGTNDLAQYLTAADRHDSDVSDLFAGANTAVLRFLHLCAPVLATLDRPMSLCGDLAADPDCLPELLRLGLSEFSVALDRVAAVDTLLAKLNSRTDTGAVV